MYSLTQRVPKAFIEHNDEWMQSSEPNSQLLRWNKKGSDLVAISTLTRNYCDIFIVDERLSRSPANLFSFAEHEGSFGSHLPRVDDLKSSDNMLSNLLGPNAQLTGDIPDIRNYLSSAYLNPKLRNRMTSFAPFDRRKIFPRI